MNTPLGSPRRGLRRCGWSWMKPITTIRTMRSSKGFAKWAGSPRFDFHPIQTIPIRRMLATRIANGAGNPRSGHSNLVAVAVHFGNEILLLDRRPHILRLVERWQFQAFRG